MYTVHHMFVPLYFYFFLFTPAHPYCPKELSNLFACLKIIRNHSSNDLSATITRHVILHKNFLQIETFCHIMEGTSYGLESKQNFQAFKMK